MSLERLIKALIGLGLTRIDAEVYVILAKKGPQTKVDLARALDYITHKISTSLTTLITKGLVTKNDEMFSALPFEEALELLIELEKKQAQTLHENKDELLASWNKNTQSV